MVVGCRNEFGGPDSVPGRANRLHHRGRGHGGRRVVLSQTSHAGESSAPAAANVPTSAHAAHLHALLNIASAASSVSLTIAVFFSHLCRHDLAPGHETNTPFTRKSWLDKRSSSTYQALVELVDESLSKQVDAALRTRC